MFDRFHPHSLHYGLTSQILRRRIAHVVGERGAFYVGDHEFAGNSSCHPLWDLAFYGLRWTFGEYEHHDDSPYRYPLGNRDTRQDDMIFALSVNARRDRYRGVIKSLPLLSEFIARMFRATDVGGVSKNLWPIVIDYLLSSQIYTAYLAR